MGQDQQGARLISPCRVDQWSKVQRRRLPRSLQSGKLKLRPPRTPLNTRKSSLSPLLSYSPLLLFPSAQFKAAAHKESNLELIVKLENTEHGSWWSRRPQNGYNDDCAGQSQRLLSIMCLNADELASATKNCERQRRRLIFPAYLPSLQAGVLSGTLFLGFCAHSTHQQPHLLAPVLLRVMAHYLKASTVRRYVCMPSTHKTDPKPSSV